VSRFGFFDKPCGKKTIHLVAMDAGSEETIGTGQVTGGVR